MPLEDSWIWKSRGNFSSKSFLGWNAFSLDHWMHAFVHVCLWCQINQSDGTGAQRSQAWRQTGDSSANSKGALLTLSEEMLVNLPKANKHFCLAIYGSAELCLIYCSTLSNFGWAQVQLPDILADQFPVFGLHNRFRQYFVVGEHGTPVCW